jgi:hypothetical protein
MAFIAAAWSESKLARHPLDVDALRGTLLQVVASNGTRCFAVIDEHDTFIRGLFVGEMSPIYLVSQHWEATDLLWLGEGIGAIRMADAFLAWALSREKVKRVTMSARDTMGNISNSAVRYLEKRGFQANGMIFEKEF